MLGEDNPNYWEPFGLSLANPYKKSLPSFAEGRHEKRESAFGKSFNFFIRNYNYNMIIQFKL